MDPIVNDYGFYTKEDTTEIFDKNDALLQIYEKINTLLMNLEANPEKKTIVWPNRQEHVQKFRNELKEILTSVGITVN